MFRLCKVCRKPVPPKPPGQTGPQPSICSDACRKKDAARRAKELADRRRARRPKGKPAERPRRRPRPEPAAEMPKPRTDGTSSGVNLGADYTAEETAFLRAVMAWKAKHKKQFPTLTELLGIARAMGYRLVASVADGQ